MRSEKRTGRVIGVMLLLQLVGFILPFALLHPLMSADYIANAATYSTQIKASILLFFANGALTIGISITAWPIFKRYSLPMAMWLIVLSVIMFVLQAVDNVHIMAMLSLSQHYAESGAPASQYEAIAYVVRITRRWAHYPELFAIDFWIMTFQATLLRFKLVPRPLVAFSLVTIVVHLFAVPVPGFLGYGISTTLGAGMALGILASGLWLIVNGFKGEPIPEHIGSVVELRSL